MPRPRSSSTITPTTAGSTATLERASPQSGVLWQSSPYRFSVSPTGLTIEMQVANSWIAVTSVPVGVVEQFLMTRGLIKGGPMMGTATAHATNGANRAIRTPRAARSSTQPKTTTASRA